VETNDLESLYQVYPGLSHALGFESELQ